MSNTQKAINLWKVHCNELNVNSVMISTDSFKKQWMEDIFGKNGMGWLLAHSTLSRTVVNKSIDFKTLYATVFAEYSYIRSMVTVANQQSQIDAKQYEKLIKKYQENLSKLNRVLNKKSIQAINNNESDSVTANSVLKSVFKLNAKNTTYQQALPSSAVVGDLKALFKIHILPSLPIISNILTIIRGVNTFRAWRDKRHVVSCLETMADVLKIVSASISMDGSGRVVSGAIQHFVNTCHTLGNQYIGHYNPTGYTTTAPRRDHKIFSIGKYKLEFAKLCTRLQYYPNTIGNLF